MTTYVYLRIPSNFDVQIITLLSAPPDANLFPVTMKQKCYDVFQDNGYQQSTWPQQNFRVSRVVV